MHATNDMSLNSVNLHRDLVRDRVILGYTPVLLRETSGVSLNQPFRTVLLVFEKYTCVMTYKETLRI